MPMIWPNPGGPIQLGDYTFHFEQEFHSRKKVVRPIIKTDMVVLLTLVCYRGGVVSLSELCKAIDQNAPKRRVRRLTNYSGSMIHNSIMRLRRVLGKDMIINVPGIGYRLNVDKCQ